MNIGTSPKDERQETIGKIRAKNLDEIWYGIQIPKNWYEIKTLLPEYALLFLSCKTCLSNKKLLPHCLCFDVNSHKCVQTCPKKCSIKNCQCGKCSSKAKRQLSHCPTCLQVGLGIYKHNNLSEQIETFVCANCDQFYSDWCKKNQLKNLTCKKEGNCFRNCLDLRNIFKSFFVHCPNIEISKSEALNIGGIKQHEKSGITLLLDFEYYLFTCSFTFWFILLGFH